MVNVYEYFVVYGDNGAMLLENWNACFDVLKHVKNAQYEGFEDEEEALKFLSEVEPEFIFD